MAFYKVCKSCGCNLDPGERCDCEEKEPLKPTKVKRARYQYITKPLNLQHITFKVLQDGGIAYVVD